MALDRDLYTYFNEDDFANIIGVELSEKLKDRGDGNQSIFLITYVSNQIRSFIYEHTNMNLFKSYDEETPNEYTISIGMTEDYTTELKSSQVNALKMACVYQADYILDSGSTERMNGVAIGDKLVSKQDLKSFEVCSMSYNLLANAGLLYRGIGGGLYAWFN